MLKCSRVFSGGHFVFGTDLTCYTCISDNLTMVNFDGHYTRNVLQILKLPFLLVSLTDICIVLISTSGM